MSLYDTIRSLTDDPAVLAAVAAAEAEKREPPDTSWVNTTPIRGRQCRGRVWERGGFRRCRNRASWMSWYCCHHGPEDAFTAASVPEGRADQ